MDQDHIKEEYFPKMQEPVIKCECGHEKEKHGYFFIDIRKYGGWPFRCLLCDACASFKIDGKIVNALDNPKPTPPQPEKECECEHSELMHDVFGCHGTVQYKSNSKPKICSCLHFNPEKKEEKESKISQSPIWYGNIGQIHDGLCIDPNHDEGKCIVYKKGLTESETPEWTEHLKDITHTDIVGIRGSCGDPCYQCQRDGHLKAFISKLLEERESLGFKKGELYASDQCDIHIKESEQRGYERREKEEKLSADPNKWRFTLEEIEQDKASERTRLLTELKEKIEKQMKIGEEPDIDMDFDRSGLEVALQIITSLDNE